MSELKITEPRKQILIAMHRNSLILLRKKTRFGMEYSFIKPSGSKFEVNKVRLNKYHFRFLEENKLVSTVYSDPISERLVLNAKGQRLGKVLFRQYNDGIFKGKAVEIEVGEMPK